MRRILTAAAIGGAILLTGCNTVRGVKQDVASLQEVMPSKSSDSRTETAPAPSGDYVPPATP